MQVKPRVLDIEYKFSTLFFLNFMNSYLSSKLANIIIALRDLFHF